MKSFWISWYSPPELGDFELVSPWWISGERLSDDALTICAAVRAEDEAGAEALIMAAYDKKPQSLEWRFCEELADDWKPGASDRFPAADWMVWP